MRVKMKVFSLPMRNWNSFSPISGSMGAEAFSAYLWGIETSRCICEDRRLKEFSAYLWGIETTMTCASIHFRFRFQPTYEELKRRSWQGKLCGSACRVFSLPMRNWNLFAMLNYFLRCHCFQPTYEELKQNKYINNKSFLFCFQPTYEELKPSSRNAHKSLARYVFSLPMRNWNSPPPPSGCSGTAFSAYLWGIETWRGHKPFHPLYLEFSAYLWGIETAESIF